MNDSDALGGIWRRIERWLAENAPDALQALNPPATAEAIAMVEREIGASLPDDFRTSMKIHDGQNRDQLGVFGWELLESTQMLEYWRLNCQVAREVPFPHPVETAGPVRPVWWDDGWIPFADDGAGNDLCLDLSPPEGGRHGQVVEYVHDASVRPVPSPTFTAWLQTVADDMEGGKFEVSDSGFPIRVSE